jgi:uncharacterized protein
MEPRLREFIGLFNEEKFFEAHEVLELLWRETQNSDRDFYQGLIQLAAALVHIQKGTPPGAEDLYLKASKHLSKYPSFHLGLDYGKILSDVRATLDFKAGFPKMGIRT